MKKETAHNDFNTQCRPDLDSPSNGFMYLSILIWLCNSGHVFFFSLNVISDNNGDI